MLFVPAPVINNRSNSRPESVTKKVDSSNHVPCRVKKRINHDKSICMTIFGDQFLSILTQNF